MGTGIVVLLIRVPGHAFAPLARWCLMPGGSGVHRVGPLPFPVRLLNRTIFGLIARSVYVQHVLHEAGKLEALTFTKRKVRF